MTRTNKRDIHAEITDTIVAAIEAGTVDFQMPWLRTSGMPANINSGKSYNGINTVSLWVTAQAKGYSSNEWGTFKQWQEKGASVRKGEKGTAVIFYKEVPANEAAETDEDNSRLIMRWSTVFNADQVDGYEAETKELPNLADRLEEVEAFIMATKADIRHGGGRAFYRPADDIIQMPERAAFFGTDTSTATEAYYSTLLHELTHWTSHKSRCDRELGKRFGSEAYAMEELVAELGAAFLCAELGITQETRPDHAAYIDSWLKVLKGDKKAIFTAASKASQAANFLKSQQPKEVKAAA